MGCPPTHPSVRAPPSTPQCVSVPPITGMGSLAKQTCWACGAKGGVCVCVCVCVWRVGGGGGERIECQSEASDISTIQHSASGCPKKRDTGLGVPSAWP